MRPTMAPAITSVHTPGGISSNFVRPVSLSPAQIPRTNIWAFDKIEIWLADYLKRTKDPAEEQERLKLAWKKVKSEILCADIMIKEKMNRAYENMMGLTKMKEDRESMRMNTDTPPPKEKIKEIKISSNSVNPTDS